MDYKERYEKALKRAETAINIVADKDLVKGVATTIFPELAESEDERIRKHLVAIVEMYWGKTNDPDKAKELAYLEKQKDLFKSGAGLYYYDGENTVYVGWPATEENPYDFAMRQQEKQKECVADSGKTSESEDERIRKWVISHFRECFNACVDNVEYQEYLNNKVIPWLEKQKEQKPKNILTDDDSLQTAYLKGQTDVLEDPEAYGLQKEQKPAEWSEEDEKTIRDACCWIAEYAGYLMDKNYGKASMLMGLTDKLKSLRPSWKPSEEDIKILEHIIGQYETGNKNSKVMGYLPRVEELNFLKKILDIWKN